MLLIAITSDCFFAEEPAAINAMFAAGLPCLHIRKPGATMQQISHLLQQIHTCYYPQISLHAHHHLAAGYPITRLHFTEQARANSQPHQWQQWQEKGYQLSTSIHQLHQLPALKGYFSYAFYGPVFNSISKQNYPGIANSHFYLHATQKSIPLIALGGITPHNITTVQQMNFDGVALLGCLWQQPQQAADIIASLLPTIHSL
ncbi:thiamine-phosphate pyrophosphorylase [Filimonas lacunae]|uniref:Thiamine-phosphate pyrophosphorylase n=1 Tax=Filimonas lacunae TaxID=477680 RepID=A0A173MP06_9BACT|nr:thiamine phosphate synthase [Filimonas lacunae]BAV09180.1 thiamin-phosphate pyrophosphorylase [Filimonas lacunae]SIS68517.1 thiamine-phosphate pyrophosphorylase [Filimonas lacunae]